MPNNFRMEFSNWVHCVIRYARWGRGKYICTAFLTHVQAFLKHESRTAQYTSFGPRHLKKFAKLSYQSDNRAMSIEGDQGCVV